MSADDRIVVTCAKRSWKLRESTAYEWLRAIQHDPLKLSGIFPGLISVDDVGEMFTAMSQFDDIDRRWENTARKALGRAAHRDWWIALNLAKICLGSWTAANGAMLLVGCDARSMPLSSWMDAAYVQMMRGMDEDKQRRFQFDLDKVPAGVRAGSTSSATKRSLAAFAAD